MDLDLLLTRFERLRAGGASTADKARRGLDLESLLADLFRLQGLRMTGSFRISGEQIDGAFEHRGWSYLVEAKWQGAKQATDALYAFQAKPDRRIEGTRGLFISISGFQRTSVERFAQGRKPNVLLWTGEHIEAILRGRTTAPELLDLSIRHAAERGEILVEVERLLASEDGTDFTEVLAACAAQVDAEIAALVGRKFIPELYVDREIQQELDVVLRPERQLESVQDELAQLGLSAAAPPPGRRREAVAQAIARARAVKRADLPRVGALARLRDQLPKALDGRLHILTDRAGTGKTNLLCHLARSYAREQPTVLLTGRSGITETTSLRQLIEAKLSRLARGPDGSRGIFDRLVALARDRDVSVLVFLDAINEHRDADLLTAALAQFLVETEHEPVTVLATCRDVYWPFFDTRQWPWPQWRELKLKLDVFSWCEFDRAFAAYLGFYRIEARFAAEARKKLAHPLILRFFCEAYGDPEAEQTIELPDVDDLRLKTLFDDYLARKLRSIRYTSPRRRRTTQELEDLLFSVAGEMRRTRRRDVWREDITQLTGQADLESPESAYVAILSEDILLEEEPAGRLDRVHVVFTYDEFMEYMIARSMVRSLPAVTAAEACRLVDECRRGGTKFTSLLGVFEYLGIILREEHGLAIWGHALEPFGDAVARAIGKLAPESVGEPEVRILAQMVHHGGGLRDAAIPCLGRIVRGSSYERYQREAAADALAWIAARDDLASRIAALRYLEERGNGSVAEVASGLTSWWSRKREEARNKVLLFSDDNRDTNEMHAELLAFRGFDHVHFALTARETLARATELRPDLIITDIDKPDMNGDRMAAEIRAVPGLRDIPIVLLSGHSYEQTPSPFCLALAKPIPPEELELMICAALAGKYEG